MTTSLTYFNVTGSWSAITSPDLGADSDAATAQQINGLVTFTPRLPVGQNFAVSAWDENSGESTAVFLLPIAAQILNGQLVSLDYTDSPSVQLVSCCEALGLAELIYDVKFSDVTYGGWVSLNVANFALQAPTDDTPVCITDPSLEQLPYQAPSDHVYKPPPAPSEPIPVGNWRVNALRGGGA